MPNQITTFRGRSIFGDMDDVFEDLFNTRRFRFPSINFAGEHGAGQLIGFPATDVKDEGNSIIVSANVPGMKASDIHIEVDENVLTLSGHVKREHEEGKKEGEYYRMEREEGSFTRTLTLPAAVDRSRVDAVAKNGVLTITLPKKEIAKSDKINVREE